MTNFPHKFAGLLAALLILGLEKFRPEVIFWMFIPILGITYISLKYPVMATWFIRCYTVGMIFISLIPPHWISMSLLCEILILWFLYGVPLLFQRQYNQIKKNFEVLDNAKKQEFDNFSGVMEDLKRENLSIDKRLREIGHLYDVIKDLGSVLTTQEMLELTKNFTDRMFDLPHFLIAVLSADDQKYEVRVTSGCDPNFLRDIEVTVGTRQLLAVLAKEKKPILVSPVQPGSRWEKLLHLSIQSFIFIPFVVQDRVIGFLCSFSNRDDFLTQEKFSNFQVFFNQVAIGLHKSLLYEEVQKLSITDGLTKLYSHRHFKQRLEEELVLAGRYASPLSLLILDIDHFKRYNDTYGHVAGDHVLIQVAGILKGQSEVTHLVARYGGEEMVLIAPETTKEKAVELAEKIRSKIAHFVFEVGQETTGVTVSIGVATFPMDAKSSTDLIGRADQALYAGKNSGRNKVVSYTI